MTTIFDRNPQLQKPGGRAAWAESLESTLEDIRARLRQRPPQEIAHQAGFTWKPAEKQLDACHLDRPYQITWPELVAFPWGSDVPCDVELQGVFLYCMVLADGAPPTRRWLNFRELPQGWLYHQAFQSYTGDVLVQAVGNDLETLRRLALACGGEPIGVGDAGFAFRGLPRVPLALIYWQGDDEFPPRAFVLFDEAACHYLPIDGCAALGRRLISRLLAEARKGESL